MQLHILLAYQWIRFVKPINSKEAYNNGLDTAASIVEEVIGGTSEGETILCGIESSKKPIDGKELTSLIPIDSEWKMQMIEETAEYLVSPKIKIRYKEDRMGAFAGIAAIHIVELIAIHMHKNGYEIIKTK